MSKFKFKENLYFDRRNSLLTFTKSKGKVLVCKSGVTATFDDLLSFLNRYIQVDNNHPENYFSKDVQKALQNVGIFKQQDASSEEAPPAGPPKQEPVEQTVESPPPKTAQPATPAPSPSKKVKAAIGSVKSEILSKLKKIGPEAILKGQCDETINNIVQDVCKTVKPRQVLTEISKSIKENEPEDKIAHAALTSQAFGTNLNLSEEELFFIAKSALVFGLKEKDRQNLPVIKQNLLSEKPSPSLAKRLKQSYHEIGRWLQQQKAEPEIIKTINSSQFIYYQTPVATLNPHATILGVTDGFLSLKNKGEKLLIIEDILTNRLKNIAPNTSFNATRIPELIQESCYNDFRSPHLKELSGGDHCEFKRLNRHLFSILIFDVSGHDEKASQIRDTLVAHLPKIKSKTNPAQFTNECNNFLLQGNVPEDRFVSFLYGVIDLANDAFIYANAGHNPPYLIQNNKIIPIKENDLLLNISPYNYTNYKIDLHQNESIVFYTDGLTEAKKHESNELFGTDRLEKALSENKINEMKAKRSVAAILNVIKDEGFTIEDDITIQVYRHL